MEKEELKQLIQTAKDSVVKMLLLFTFANILFDILLVYYITGGA